MAEPSTRYGTTLEHKSLGAKIHENAVATVISTANIKHPVFGLFAATKQNGATFLAGVRTAITAFADATGGEVQATATGHGLSTGQWAGINGTTSYNGMFQVTVVDVNNFKITATWVADDATGFVTRGDQFTINPGGDGAWHGNFSMSGSAAAVNKEYEWHILVSGVESQISHVERRFSSSDIGAWGGVELNDLVTGDVIQVSVTGLTDTSNFTHHSAGLVLHKL